VCVRGTESPSIMEKYDSIPSLGEQQTSSRVFTCLVVFAEVIRRAEVAHRMYIDIRISSSGSSSSVDWMDVDLCVQYIVQNKFTIKSNSETFQSIKIHQNTVIIHNSINRCLQDTIVNCYTYTS